MAPKEVSVIVKAIDALTGPIKEMRSGVSSFVGVVKGLGATLVGSAVGAWFKSAAEEGIKAEDSIRRLGVSVKNAGGDFGILRPAINQTVDSVQRLSNQTDDDLRNALTKLIATTGDVAGSMGNLGLVADVAAERHIDLDAAAVLVGKTMNGNLTPLMKAYGVEVKSSADGIQLLHDRTDGYAKTATEGLGGALTNLNIQWGELKEAVGLAIVGSDGLGTSTDRLSGLLIDLQKWVQENEGAIGGFIDKVITLGGAIKDLSDGILKFHPIIAATRKVLSLFGDTSEVTAAQVVEGNQAVVAATAQLGGAFRTTQKDMTDTLIRNTGIRTVKTREELETEEKARKESAAREKRAAAEQAKYLEEAREDLAVKTLMLEKHWTEEHAKEWVKRQKNQGLSLGVILTDLKGTYALIDDANKKLGEGFMGIAPKVQVTATKMVELRQTLVNVQPILDDLSLTLSDVGNANVGVGETTKKAKLEFEDAARAGTSFAHGLGLIDDAAAAGIGNMVTLGDAMAKFTMSGGNPSAIVGIIGGLTGVLGSIFAGDAERLAMIRRNAAATEKLASVNGELLALNTPGRVFGAVQSFFAKDHPSFGGPGGRARLTSELAKSGLTMAEFVAAGKDLGFDVLNSAGGVNVLGLQGFKAGAAEVEFSSFGNTFRDQMKRIGIGKDIGAIGGGDELAQVIGAIGLGGPNAITGSLTGLDLSSASGSGEAVANLRSLFNNIGTLAPGDFGGLSQSEFLESIQSLISLLTDDIADTGGILVSGGIATSPFADLPVAFDTMAAETKEQTGVLESIDTKLGILIDVTQFSGGVVNVTQQSAGIETINEGLATLYRRDQMATGSAVRS